MDARTTCSAVEIRPIKRCIACSEEGRRLSLFNGPKLNHNPELLQHIIAFLDLGFVSRTEFPRLFICEPCMKRIDAYYNYRRNARAVASSYLQSLKPKRAPNTPQGNNEKRKRVVDNLVSSIEKLKLRQTEAVSQASGRGPIKTSKKSLFDSSPSAANDSIDGIHSFNSCTESVLITPSFAASPTDHSYPVASPSISFNVSEHSYTTPPLNLRSDNDSVCTVESALRIDDNRAVKFDELVVSIKNAVRRLSAPNKSVLSKTAPETLTDTNVFALCVEELKTEMPLLFEVLHGALGVSISIDN